MRKRKEQKTEEIEDPFEGVVIDAEEVIARKEANKDDPILSSVLNPIDEIISPDGRYKKSQVLLGEGSYKKVYKAIDNEEGKEVAWNQVRIRKGDAEKQFFAMEVELLKKISHPNILKIFDHWFTKSNIIFITELMTGGTLREYITGLGGNLSLKLIRKWGLQILDGLDYLHNQNPPVIHRDLKCENIFVNATLGEVKIGDLGIARERRMKRYTVVGTPQFMAREMFEGNGYNEKVDVYAFGMCLVEMATGMYPYRECITAAEVYKAIMAGVTPVSLSTIKNFCLRNLILSCLVVSKDRLSAKDAMSHHFFDPESTCNGSCIPSEVDQVVPLTAPANDMEISLVGIKDDIITLQLFFMSEAKFIKFNYDLTKDDVNELTKEMIEEDIVEISQRTALTEMLTKGIMKAINTREVERIANGISKDDLLPSVVQKEEMILVNYEDFTVDEVVYEKSFDPNKKTREGYSKKDEIEEEVTEGEKNEEEVTEGEVIREDGKETREDGKDTIQVLGDESIQETVDDTMEDDSIQEPCDTTVDGVTGDDSIQIESNSSGSNYFESVECPNKKYNECISIEEFSNDIAILVKRSPESAQNWIKIFKTNDIEKVTDLKILVEEDWDRLGLTVFSSRAMKNVLYGMDKDPIKEKHLIESTNIKDYSDKVEIQNFLREISTQAGKEGCASVWGNKLLAQDIRTVGELKSLNPEDWDRLGLSVFSYRLIKNTVYKKEKY